MTDYSPEELGLPPAKGMQARPSGMTYSPDQMAAMTDKRQAILEQELAQETDPENLKAIQQELAGLPRQRGGAAPRPTGTPATKPTSESSQEEFSPEELGLPPPRKPQSTSDQFWGTAATVGDFLSNIPEFFVVLGAEIGGDIQAAKYAFQHPEANVSRKEIFQAGNVAKQAVEDLSPLHNLGSKALKYFRPETTDPSNPVGTALGKVGGLIEDATKKAESMTGGAIPSEAFGQAVDVAQLAIPELAGRAVPVVRQIFKNRAKKAGIDPKDNAAFEEFANRQTPPTEQELNEVKDSLDNHRNAEAKAQDLMRRGASRAEVLRAIKRNSLVEQKMEEIRQRRAAAKEAYDPDFGARGGDVMMTERLRGPASEPTTVEGELGHPKLPGEVRPPAEEAAAEKVASEEKAAAAEGQVPEHTAMEGAVKRRAKDKGVQAGELGLKDYGIMAGVFGVPLGAYWAYTHPDQAKEMGAAAAAIGGIAVGAKLAKGRSGASLLSIGALPPKLEAGTMAAEQAASKYTLRVFEKLPQNKSEFSKETVVNLAKMAGIPQVERDVVGRILEKIPGDTVTARELMAGMREATEDFVLTHKAKTGAKSHADYGLERIGSYEERAVYSEAPQTNLYNLPREHFVPHQNHFGETNNYGHTRSFGRDGVTHVVEIQSDLVQNSRPLSEEKFQELVTERQKLVELFQATKLAIYEATDEFEKLKQDSLSGSLSFKEHSKLVEVGAKLDELKRAKSEIALRFSEVDNRINGAVRGKDLGVRGKNPERRLIREELGRAAERLHNAEERLRDADKVDPAVWEAWKEEADKARVVRFADAETVAKVEGWRRITQEEINSQKRALNNIRDHLQLDIKHHNPSAPFPRSLEDLQTDLEEAKKDLEEVEKLQAGQFEEPGHQSIYDRYKGDITKYLKQLGGKEVTDKYGHGWVEVPVGKKGPINQYGFADPKMLGGIAAVLGGMYLGAALADRDKLEAAIIGGAAGVAAMMLPKVYGHISKNMKEAAGIAATTGGLAVAATQIDKDHPIEGAMIALAWGASRLLPKKAGVMIGKMDIRDHINLMNGAKASIDRQAVNVARGMTEAVPDPARREAIAKAVDSGNLKGLSPAELKVAQVWQNIAKDFGQMAKDQGLIKDLIQNYISHIVERTSMPKSKVQELMDSLFGVGKSGGLGTRPSFTKERTYKTFQDLQDALQGTDLKIKTMDIADIAHAYIQGMGRAVENKKLINNLMAAKAGGSTYIAEIGKAPHGYVAVDTPQMRGLAVHPELAPHLKFVLQAADPGMIRSGLLGLSMAQKRVATSASLFHAYNLMNAYVSANGLRSVGGKASIDAALDLYRKGGNGDVVDHLLRGGLKVEAGRPGEADLQALAKAGAVMDDFINRTLGTKQGMLEGTLGKIEEAQRKTFDKLTWDYLHTGMKLDTAINKFSKIVTAEGGLDKLSPERLNQIAKEVSSFTNDVFGGLDWYRVATESRSALMEKVFLNGFSPNGRQWLQILMFAPDWTMSTFRAMYKALPGTTDMPLTKKMHQAYVVRTAMMYFVLMNGLNMALSGHPIWQNKEGRRTLVDNGDGTYSQIAKHATEAAEDVMAPTKALLGKMGAVPKEVMEQALRKDYLTDTGKGPPMGSRVGHALKKFSPIPLQIDSVPGRSVGRSVVRSALSAGGIPQIGLSTKEQAQLKADAKRKTEITRLKKELGIK